jgi:DNA polymerase
MTPEQKLNSLKALRAECYSCKRCGLSENIPPLTTPSPRPYVFASGKISSKIMLVGQNPGLTEVKEGRPFVGKSGQQLSAALDLAGLDRKSLYITNGVLCYTVNNSLPPDVSVDSCKYYLKSQIDLVQPEVIVVMGKSAARSFIFDGEFTVNMCKEARSWKTDLHPNVYFAVHPAYTIYSKDALSILSSTFKKIKQLV